MRRKERKRYIELAFLVSLTRFIIQIIAALIAAGVIYLLHIMDIVPLKNNIGLEPISLIFYMIAISIASGLIAILITMKVSADPLTYIIQKIEQLASGNFKVRINFNGFLSRSPVLVEFADSFNKMAHELEKTEMLREDFVNNFSHEFKTPIVSIAGFASVLRKGNLTKELQEQYLAVIEEEALRLSALATKEGNGIGLAIVKRVIALHKGTVSVQSENGLTMFSVQLPKRR